MNDPVDFVLRHRTELALTPPQMASLEKLAVALRDSSAARTARRMRQAQQYARLPGLASVMQWNGAVDESAIREAMRQQSLLQAEIMIASARDRRAVGAILTPTQLAKLPQLQTAEMLKAAQGESR